MTDIKTIGVVGCGTMGTGIAIVAARAGFKTRLYDTHATALEQAYKQAAAFLGKSVARGKLPEGKDQEILANMHITTDLVQLSDCDLIIEAVFEDLQVKHDIFSQLNKICPEHTIFASNTSTIAITDIAGGSGRDDRFVGMHFCLPAQLMKLVEMSAGIKTSEQTFNRAWAACEAMGQKPVRTKDTPGFILNYFLIPWHNDVINMVDQGVADPSDIDLAVKTALGYPLGPLELLDMVGMDTQRLLCEAMHGLTHEPRAACPPLVKRMISAGLLGRKSGQGFYRYDENKIFGA
ncbi:MAG: 3-hydroxyacyl-CoA dehydrogenase family protein [Burkholderiaceae bacterium]|nr:3-hydroxyacyl-CoA dehydrogenase family protein [Burkholderiaceae bacterium]MCD8564543.1 3-hydroxyacyl-CoA dehydrogenase family protein [Burkholderiaceae bacterium]